MNVMPIANPFSLILGDFPNLIIDTEKVGLDEETAKRVRELAAPYKKLAIELGSGSGEHLLTRAAADKDTFYIGIEIRFKRIYNSAKKAHRENISNILFVRMFAEDIFTIINPCSLDFVYVNFPDPWDKKRWHKHRLLNPTFFSSLLKLLKPTAVFLFKTDHPGYFQVVIESLKGSRSWKITKESWNLYDSAWIATNIPTEFEKLFLSKGKPVHFLEACPVGE